MFTLLQFFRLFSVTRLLWRRYGRLAVDSQSTRCRLGRFRRPHGRRNRSRFCRQCVRGFKLHHSLKHALCYPEFLPRPSIKYRCGYPRWLPQTAAARNAPANNKKVNRKLMRVKSAINWTDGAHTRTTVDRVDTTEEQRSSRSEDHGRRKNIGCNEHSR